MGEVVEIVYFPNHDWHRKNKTNRKNLINSRHVNICKLRHVATLLSLLTIALLPLHNSADSKQNHGKSLQS